MVQSATDVPAFYDFQRILSSRAITLGPLPQEKYQALFAQYFLFDVLDQQKVFYQEVQLFLSGLCESLLTEYCLDSQLRVSFEAFHTEGILERSKDRIVDSFVDCCLVLTHVGLVLEDRSALLIQQFNEANSYSLHRLSKMLSICG